MNEEQKDKELNKLSYYWWNNQSWYIGTDLALYCGNNRRHFKDFPRSLKLRGVVHGYKTLSKQELKEFKESVLNKDGRNITASKLSICNPEIAKLYIQENSTNKVDLLEILEIDLLSQDIKKEDKEDNTIKSETVDNVEKELVQEVQKDKEDIILYNTVISEEFKYYLDKYNLKYIVWCYQPWFVGTHLSKAIGLSKFHFNYYGDQQRKLTSDTKCLLINNFLLNQFKQAVEANHELKEEFKDIKFCTSIFICDWTVALGYLKKYAKEEASVLDNTKVPSIEDNLSVKDYLLLIKQQQKELNSTIDGLIKKLNLD